MKKSILGFMMLSLLSLNAHSMDNDQKKYEDLLAKLPSKMRAILKSDLKDPEMVVMPDYQGRDFGKSYSLKNALTPICNILSDFSDKKNLTILDGGTGAGQLTRCFTLLEATVEAVELNPWALETNKNDFKNWIDALYKNKKISEDDYKKMFQSYQVRQGDILKLDLKENTYDLVFLSNVLHFTNPEELDKIIFPTVYKGLKPGGKVVVIAHTPSQNCKELVDYYFDRQKSKVPYPGYAEVNHVLFLVTKKDFIMKPRVPKTLNEPVSLIQPGFYDEQDELKDIPVKKIGKLEEMTAQIGDKFILHNLARGIRVLVDWTDEKRPTIKKHLVFHFFTQGPLKEAMERAGLKVSESYFMDEDGLKIDSVKQSDFLNDTFGSMRVVVSAVKPN